MSAERLREAARLMRDDWPLGEFCPSDCNCEQDGFSYHPQAETFQAVADWLEDQGDAFEAYMNRQADPERRFNSLWLARAQGDHEHALAVANAYLGGA